MEKMRRRKSDGKSLCERKEEKGRKEGREKKGEEKKEEHKIERAAQEMHRPLRTHSLARS